MYREDSTVQCGLPARRKAKGAYGLLQPYQKEIWVAKSTLYYKLLQFNPSMSFKRLESSFSLHVVYVVRDTISKVLEALGSTTPPTR